MNKQMYVFGIEEKSIGYELVENGKLTSVGRGHEDMIAQRIELLKMKGYMPILGFDSIGKSKPISHELKSKLMGMVA